LVKKETGRDHRITGEKTGEARKKTTVRFPKPNFAPGKKKHEKNPKGQKKRI